MVILVSIVTVAYVIVSTQQHICRLYSCLSFPGIEQWRVKEEHGQKNNYWKGVISHPEYIVRLEVFDEIEPKRGEELTQTKLMQISGLYEKAVSPYPGVISDAIVCSKEYLPIMGQLTVQNETEVQYLTAFLNDRLQYGSCIESQLTSTVTAATIYCHNTRQWFFIEFVQSRDDDNQLNFVEQLKQLNCTN